MSDITDNTSELDSYGVWVKPNGAPDASDALDLDLGITELGDDLDLSDFDVAVETPEPAEDAFADFDLPEEPAAEPAEEVTEDSASMDDFQLPEEDGEISIDDFLDGGFSDESVASGNNGFAPGAEPSANKTEEVSLDEFSDGEISLDDFLDGGDFTSGPAPEVKETKTEEIVDEKPLDMDISFDSEAETIATEDNIQEDEEFDDEPAFESFDDSDRPSISESAMRSTEIFGDTEEIDLSDFGIDADAEETPITQDIEESKLKDKVVDFDLCVSDEKLSSAPIVNEITESAAEPEDETPVAPVAPVAPAPVQEAAPAPANTASVSNDLLQQIINELSGMKAEINALKTNLEEIQTKQAEPAAETEAVIEETPAESVESTETSGFFDDIDGDDTIALSGDELDNMINSVVISEETVEPEPVAAEEEPVVEEAIEETIIEESEPVIEETVVEEEPVIEDIVIEESEPVIEETVVEEEPVIEESEVIIPETEEEDTNGFFDGDDGDDTIALSVSELDNMLSGVEINETEEPIEEPLEDITLDDLESEGNEDIPEEIDIEPVPTETVEDDIFGAVEEDIFETEDETITLNEEPVEESEEVLEEPNLDDMPAIDIEEDELPEEISIDKTEDFTDDILVESANNDFMESVKDTTPEEPVIEEPLIEEAVAEETVIEEDNAPITDFEEFMEEPTAEESLTESNIDYLNEDETVVETEEEIPAEEPVAEEVPAEDDFPSVDIFDIDEPAVTEENGFIAEPAEAEETIAEETVIDEPAEEPVIEETSVVVPEEKSEEPVNDDLKKDIKSVLLYMDQLLENLPEDKIVEFAKSEEFATYKKLFSELGLA